MKVVVSPHVLSGGGPLVTAEIRERRPEIDLEHVEDADDLPAAVADAEVLVTHRLPDEILEGADGLEWVQALSAGTDRFDHDALADRGVALTNVSGIHAKPIGQQVLGYLLHFERGFDRAIAQQDDREWERYMGGELGDRTVGIVGVGAIGSKVADYCQTFDARVIGTKRDPTDAPESVDEIYGPGELESVLAESDYLVIACPLTDETRGLIDAEALATLPEDAVLVNIARGQIVDQSALVDALAAGDLGGAALDVFEEEPLPESSPLWDRDDVLVTPHMAGSTPHYWERCADVFLRNYDRFRDGETLENRVV
ncbi:D-isomer specific 2-hydroxyacid dehydrogenase NAD-binding protein [Natrinema pellirubrum DSM 15624]|uniref:D-isomer specific 2-hydroxyacid dehydrogenase NAD-binding protein n=1 Tax=Natrinema pellirubrum (strain DSM 15624 / CIP 106293 / JCM 10476 / NCIMB 786 / 157) TaxID=797303 RepID=L0JSK2_NATP1|nr:D-2-hydroxyacid dehydrogenase [Natrinema pellirubrum]AGB33336.1 phosphoglycerate dehydrogenase-like oxidoreductase [Natrinema pellirubrum DSM 15624]ELY71460.1 D-isomer specific 2-hydroxyacid dehydrogenase NAD-binding protein [Natrinema pellirubrum DSM 15624]